MVRRIRHCAPVVALELPMTITWLADPSTHPVTDDHQSVVVPAGLGTLVPPLRFCHAGEEFSGPYLWMPPLPHAAYRYWPRTNRSSTVPGDPDRGVMFGVAACAFVDL